MAVAGGGQKYTWARLGGGGAEGDDDDAAAGVSRYVEIVAMFQTDYFISGIAPFGDALVILAFMPDDDVDAEDGDGGGENNNNNAIGAGGDYASPNGGGGGDGRRRPSQRPEVRIVSWTNEDLTCDALGIKGFEAYQANDYRLAALLPAASGRSAVHVHLTSPLFSLPLT